MGLFTKYNSGKPPKPAEESRFSIKIKHSKHGLKDFDISHKTSVNFLLLTVLFISFKLLGSQNAPFPTAAFDDFYMKGDPGLPSEVPTSLDNSQLLQNTGFNSQGIMPANAVNDGSAGIQISNCIVGQSTNGGIYESTAGRPHSAIPSSSEVW